MPGMAIFQEQQEPKDIAKEQLAKSLGNGLANFYTNYQAQKSLSKVLSDPKLKDSPVSERLEKIEASQRPYGEIGQNILQQRLGIEEQMMQQKEQGALSKVFAKMQRGESLNEKDAEGISQQNLIKLAEIDQKMTAARNKPAPGGVTAQPVPREVATAINNVLNANKGASADELTVAMDEAGVPRVFSNATIESRRRQDEAGNKALESRNVKKGERDSQIIKDVDATRKALPLQRSDIEVMKNAVLTGDLGFFSGDKFADKLGFEAFRSKQGAAFKTAVKDSLIQDIAMLTGRPNQWIEQQIADSYAQIGRPQDANMASIAILDFKNKANKAWTDIVDELEDNDAYPPGKLGRVAAQKFDKWFSENVKGLNKEINSIAEGKIKPEDFAAPEGKVVMYAPDGGTLYVNPDQVDYYKSKGATTP